MRAGFRLHISDAALESDPEVETWLREVEHRIGEHRASTARAWNWFYDSAVGGFQRDFAGWTFVLDALALEGAL